MGMDRDTLAALADRVDWEPLSGEDGLGNNFYGPAARHNAYLDTTKSRLGADGGHGKQENGIVDTRMMLTDALGIKPGDRITDLQGRVWHVETVDSGKDADANDYYQQSIITSERNT